MASNMWTADRRLYLDKDGKVVEANDPTRQRLLIAQGGNMPLELAQKYGLVTVTPAVVETVAPQAPETSDEGAKAKAPALNKAKLPGENK